MPNQITNPSFFPVRVNDYVAAMQYSADVGWNGATRIPFGAPLAANATLVASAQSIAVAGSFDLTSVAQFPETYGRNLSLVASGSSTASITVNGWDYIGQPISETFTLNSGTAVPGNKAFKTMRSVVVNTVTAAITINIGSGVKLGLPYKAIRCAYEIANGLSVAAGTLQNPSLVDPQTATTTDPRGMYTTTTALNGTNIIDGVFDFVNDVNATGNGGLMGLRQFSN